MERHNTPSWWRGLPSRAEPTLDASWCSLQVFTVSISVFLVEQCCRNHYANEKMTSPEGDKTECKNSDSMRETGWFFGPRQAAQRVEGEDGVLPDPCGEESQRENAPTRIHRRTDWSAESPHISQPPVPRPSPQSAPEALPYPILRRVSSPSGSCAMPWNAFIRHSLEDSDRLIVPPGYAASADRGTSCQRVPLTPHRPFPGWCGTTAPPWAPGPVG
jgi:hypothetical protein